MKSQLLTLGSLIASNLDSALKRLGDSLSEEHDNVGGSGDECWIVA